MEKEGATRESATTEDQEKLSENFDVDLQESGRPLTGFRDNPDSEETTERSREKYSRKCKRILKDNSKVEKIQNLPVSWKTSVRYRPEFWEDEETFNLMKEGKKPLTCNKCFITLTSLKGLAEHWRRGHCLKLGLRGMQFSKMVTENEVTKFACAHPDCENIKKVWNMKGEVNGHWNNQHKDYAASIYGLASCKHCPETFVTQTLLNAHIKRVHGETYHCKLCEFASREKRALIIHERKHAGVKPYQCEHCELRFVSASHKREHQKQKHPSEIGYTVQQHVCEKCGKSFKGPWRLQEHMTSHAEQPNPKFQCKICLKFLKQANSYHKHMRNVHRIGHLCGVCERIYLTQRALMIHKREKHGVTVG